MDFDPDRMMDVASNLLSNAIKFTPEGGDVYISVEGRRHTVDGIRRTADGGRSSSSIAHHPSIIIKIKDTGIGIPSEKLPHIFDRFYQAGNRDAARAGEGTGIGLALTKELIHLMNGDIQVESIPGQGTTFTITLPVARKAPETLVEAGFDLKTAAVVPPTSIGQAIQAKELAGSEDLPLALIVEDNPDVLQYIASCLEKDYRLAFAQNGQTGIDKALELVPDIIVSDVMMPEKDGFEVCQTLKNGTVG